MLSRLRINQCTQEAGARQGWEFGEGSRESGSRLSSRAAGGSPEVLAFDSGSGRVTQWFRLSQQGTGSDWAEMEGSWLKSHKYQAWLNACGGTSSGSPKTPLTTSIRHSYDSHEAKGLPDNDKETHRCTTLRCR